MFSLSLSYATSPFSSKGVVIGAKTPISFFPSVYFLINICFLKIIVAHALHLKSLEGFLFRGFPEQFDSVHY